MTATQSLSERLRKVAAKWPSYSEVGDILLQAADVLDAKDKEIARLRGELDRLQHAYEQLRETYLTSAAP